MRSRAEGLFAEDNVISTENVLMVCKKSNSGSVLRIVHVCGLKADSGTTIYVGHSLT
jgi:hypothetical protein